MSNSIQSTSVNADNQVLSQSCFHSDMQNWKDNIENSIEKMREFSTADQEGQISQLIHENRKTNKILQYHEDNIFIQRNKIDKYNHKVTMLEHSNTTIMDTINDNKTDIDYILFTLNKYNHKVAMLEHSNAEMRTIIEEQKEHIKILTVKDNIKLFDYSWFGL
jgi:hypothetical protein